MVAQANVKPHRLRILNTHLFISGFIWLNSTKFRGNVVKSRFIEPPLSQTLRSALFRSFHRTFTPDKTLPLFFFFCLASNVFPGLESVGRIKKKRPKKMRRRLRLGGPVPLRYCRGAWKQQEMVTKSTCHGKGG